MKGFTLAETLITLGIIGVVALIISNVVNNYQDKVRLTALKKSYSVISQAHNLVVQDIGEYWKVNGFISYDSNGWHTQNINEITDLYAEKLKDGLAQYCGEFASGQISTKGCKNLATGQKWHFLNGDTATYNSLTSVYNKYHHTFLYELKDGTHISIKPGAGNWIMIQNKIMLIIMVDINGYQKPDQIGKDIFFFAVRTDSPQIVASNFSGIDNAFIGQKSTNAYQGIESYDPKTQKDCTQSGTGYSCAYAIMQNGWEFPKNYHRKVN